MVFSLRARVLDMLEESFRQLWMASALRMLSLSM
jgi:hypothetical protein